MEIGSAPTPSLSFSHSSPPSQTRSSHLLRCNSCVPDGPIQNQQHSGYALEKHVDQKKNLA